ncbi:MAG: DUF6084 family protein [Methylacidiphilales bacterium]|nr:DUF6084 family protein [Candidatus Methylacidiphilales bacterium]
MPDLDFKITGIEAGARGLTPLLNFKVEVTQSPATETIHTVILQAQIQIQTTRRRYDAREKEKLTEIFGSPERWGETLRTKLWTITQTTVPSFSGSTTALLTVPCTFDLNVMVTKYFYALEEGEVPLLFLFSGTIFYEAADGRLQVQQIPWNKECAFPVPVKVWQELMDHHYPNMAWLTLNREVFERLYAYRRSRGIPTWEQTIEQLLPAMEDAEAAL